MKTVVDVIRESNPSYNPIETACEKAGIDPDYLKNAIDRVYTDGYFGPISAGTWEEEDGREPYSVAEALEILAKVAENVEDYWDSEDGEFGFDFNNRVDAHDIVKSEWKFLIDIYGSLPF